MATVAHADPTPRPVIGHCILENGNRKACVEWQPKATPTPVATATPKPTVSPLPCEPLGGEKSYRIGEEKMFCFDAGDKRPFMEVQSVNLANTSCSALRVNLVAPNGAQNDEIASQPAAILPWAPGRWYLWTKLIDGWCFKYTFTAR